MMKKYSYIKGDLEGTYEDVLIFLEDVITKRANRYFKKEEKGEAFYNAIQTLKDRFGVSVSTHFLKQFCNKDEKHIYRHILYMLRIGGFIDNEKFMLNPIKVNFKGFIDNNGTRSISPKVFNFLVSPQNWNDEKARVGEFKAKCLKEWEEHKQLLEREQIESDKLKMVSALEEKPIDYQELEDVSPHLKEKDRTLMQKVKSVRGYH